MAMRDAAAIKQAVERNVKAVGLRASLGQGTAKSVATLGDGLSCTAREGAHTFHIGMPAQYGGSGEAPSP
jgi:hypothetical protein